MGCSAPNCSNHSRKGYRLYRFPADLERRKKWLINCGRPNWDPAQHRLCSEHFEPSQFEQHRADGRKLLKPNAVPTIFNFKNTPKLAFKRCFGQVMIVDGYSCISKSSKIFNSVFEDTTCLEFCEVSMSKTDRLSPIFDPAMEGKVSSAAENSPPPLKKPKLENESDDDQSQPVPTSFVEVKSEFPKEEVKSELKEETIEQEELLIKDEIEGSEGAPSGSTRSTQTDSDESGEESEEEYSGSSASTQTDSDESDRFKEEFHRIMTKMQPKKQIIKGPKIEATENHIFQFKVTLVRGRGAPPIWRRIQVPGNYNFRDLHLAIQKSMGWKSVEFDYHLHAFEMVNPSTGFGERIVMKEDVNLYGGAKDEEAAKIIDYFTVVGMKAKYEYDFGIGWIHDVVSEGAFVPKPEEKYPKCVEGAKACPPEDGGGCEEESDEEEYDSDQFDPNLCF